MVQVPPGCFDMGASGEGGRRCFDAPFWIGQTEVTNTQYAEFVSEGGYNERRYWTLAGWGWKTENDITAPMYYSGFRSNDQPRVGVSWYEALAYTNWLTERLRANGRIGQDEEIRLPTESEWEYAARGPSGFIYPWGNAWHSPRLNGKGIEDGYEDVTAPVGHYPFGASWVGALDMSGNVWEFTLSTDRTYPYDSIDGRNNTSGGAKRVMRGGSFFSMPELTKTTYRRPIEPQSRYTSYGFRVVLVTP